MTNTAAESIQVGALTVRFHVDADESGGSVSVFECDVPANARMPAPHSHDEFDETVFGLDGVTAFTVGGGAQRPEPSGRTLYTPARDPRIH
jgi:quercetin dioxygenase-like cupin family protein